MTQKKLNEKLLYAVYEKNTDEVKEALSLGADINSADDNGWTVLMYAAYYGHIDIVRLFLEHGADINAVNKYGTTALMYTCRYGHTDIVKLLLEHGADVNLIDCDEATALMQACCYGYTDIVKLLIKHGADINAVNKYGNTAFDMLKTGHPQKYQKLIEDTAIKARKKQLDTEDSLTGPVQDVLPDWNI